ncbi:MAG: extracellular solute-binding protein [Candidatus Pacebacteria bacterium]|nr:extracellular solute-binding protein [Candidatus Paceibacterota bacterium]PIR60908.1 MAG: hypothetical protein COU67_00420 [Candidatus Pacebacteria bacterium CG10_big_fil_rev_8_21_14_0_10_44_54]
MPDTTNTALPKPTPPPSAMPAPSTTPQPVPPTQPIQRTQSTQAQTPTPTPAAPASSTVSALPPSRAQAEYAAKSTSTTQLPPSTLTALSSMSSSKVPNTILPETKESVETKKAAALPQASAPDSLKVVPEKTKNTVAQSRIKLASLKKSPLRFLPFILIGFLVIGVAVFAYRAISGGSRTSVTPPSSSGSGANSSAGGASTPSTSGGQAVTLEYWGLWEPAEVMTQVLSDFEKANPGVSIRYTKQSYRDYRQRLQTAIASGNGPDLFRFHASWTPMLSAELARMPASVYSAAEYQKTFYPAAAAQLQVQGQLVGIPLMYDGLALFYNKEALQTAAVDPPTTWSELRTLAAKLTIKSGSEIKRGGVALGNATNVDHFSDIIALLMLQNGADLAEPNSAEGRDALLFYTNFQKADGVWNSVLPSSTVAFARGEAAMLFAPSWRAHDISAINPDLQFGITSVPQLSDTRIAWASFWAEGVSQQSKQQELSWKLLEYLSSKEVQLRLHADQAGLRAFGEIYSRTDLADQAASNEFMRPYLQDAPFASGWYLSSATFDAGINDQLIGYYEKAVTGLLGSSSMNTVLTELEQGTTQTLTQYSAK